jgi:hypothetical protein
MASKLLHKKLIFGRDVAVSFSNIEDCQRFKIAMTGHLNWGYRWIMERMSLSGPVGVLQHSKTGFSFDTYRPIAQVNPFYNILASPGCFFSSYYMRIKSEEIRNLADQNYFTDICCPLQLHVLSKDVLENFIKRAVRALKKNGNLILSFNLWTGCDSESKEILRKSKVLLQNNKNVNHPLGIYCDTILEISRELSLPNSANKDVLDEQGPAMEKTFLNDDRIITQHSRTVFKRNYPEKDQKYLQVADSVRSLTGCLWFKKCGAK